MAQTEKKGLESRRGHKSQLRRTLRPGIKKKNLRVGNKKRPTEYQKGGGSSSHKKKAGQ